MSRSLAILAVEGPSDQAVVQQTLVLLGFTRFSGKAEELYAIWPREFDIVPKYPPKSGMLYARVPMPSILFTKYPMRRGKSHRVMTPIEFMARLASIVAPPRAHSLRYHGVLAANAKWRKLIVPLRERGEQTCGSAGQPAKQSAKSEQRAKKASADLSLLAVTTAQTEANWRPSTSDIPWVELLKRSFDFDVLECKKCKGRMQPIAVITEREVIERILSHLSLPQQMEAFGSSGMIGCDISDEAIAEWEWNQSTSDADEPGPPDETYFVDAPSPDD